MWYREFGFRVLLTELVEECSIRAEAVGVSRGGVYGSKNAGISSKKAGDNPARRKSKVSWATRIDPGLVDPKASPSPMSLIFSGMGEGVTDGRAG